MRLVCLFTAAAFSLAALTGTAYSQATPMTEGQMESAGKDKKAAKPAKKGAKKPAKKSSQ
jgi:hypothetical protein